MAEVSAKVVLTTKNYVAEAKMRNHYAVMDRPVNKGGGDTGPTPIECLLSAIAGCVSMTLRVYLENKNWEIGAIEVTVTLKERLTNNGIEKIIMEEISFEKEVSELKKEKLLQVAAKCPVVKMIKGETKVLSKIK